MSRSRMSRWQAARTPGVCAIVFLLVFLTGCTIGYRPESPEVRYSPDASAATALQVPPDLSDIRDGEQFVLPGDVGSAVSRDTLLPVFESATYQRSDGQSWLQMSASVEKIWPRLLAFIRDQDMQVAQTEPVSGLIMTRWMPLGGNSVFRNLVAGADYQRIAFRLERAGTGSRLFSRSQQSDKLSATAEGADTVTWPAASHDAEQTSLLLQRLLVFLGLEEQKAKGIVSEQAAAEVLDNARLEFSAGGSRLIVHQGYILAVQSIGATLDALGFSREPEKTPGILQVIDNAAVVGDEPERYALLIDALHVSAVKVSVLDAEGNPAEAGKARRFLAALQSRLS